MKKTAAELAAAIGAKIIGDGSAEIRGVASPERAGAHDLIYVDSAKHSARAANSAARCAIVGEGVELAGKTLRWEERVFGDTPTNGHSLWISMHGGGNAPARINDRQWTNQISLYKLAEGIYVAPRLGRMRISPHVYNDEQDVDRFLATFRRLVLTR